MCSNGRTSTARLARPRFDSLFDGPPREAETKLTQREMDLARSVQEVTEEVMLRLARTLHRETGSDNLCLAGGVALNCVANGRLLREGPFEQLWIQPAAGDAGGAVGAALYGWHQVLDNPRRADGVHDGMHGAYLGPRFGSDEIASWLDAQGYPYERVEGAARAQRIARAIADGDVVGLLQGRMEFGPRALGHRSIIGDARSPAMQSILNIRQLAKQAGEIPFEAFDRVIGDRDQHAVRAPVAAAVRESRATRPSRPASSRAGRRTRGPGRSR